MKAYKVTENGVEKIKVANKPLGGAPVYYASKLSNKVQYFNTTPQYTVIGNPTISNNMLIANGNTYLNCLLLNRTLNIFDYDFDIVIKIKDIGSSTNRIFLSFENSFQCAVSNGGGIYMSAGGNDYYNWNTPSATGDIWLRWTFTKADSGLSIGKSSDGVNYSMGNPQTVTSIPSVVSVGRLRPGSEVVGGVYLTDDTYIKISNTLLFRGGFPNWQE